MVDNSEQQDLELSFKTTYDSSGRKIRKIISAKDGTEQTDYDRDGRIVKEVFKDVNGKIESLYEAKYNSQGILLYWKKEAGQQMTEEKHDDRGILRLRRMSSGPSEHEDIYDDQGRLVESVERSHNHGKISITKETNRYDEKGCEVESRRVTENELNITYRTCDENGRVVHSQYDFSSKYSGYKAKTTKDFVDYVYDRFGHVIAETWADEDGRVSRKTARVYQNNLLVREKSEGENRSTTKDYTYDKNGHKLTEKEFSKDGTMISEESRRYKDDMVVEERVRHGATWEMRISSPPVKKPAKIKQAAADVCFCDEYSLTQDVLGVY